MKTVKTFAGFGNQHSASRSFWAGVRTIFSAAILTLVLTAWSKPVLAQTFTNLFLFDGTDGADPMYGPLIQGTDGNFYGTTLWGGANCTNIGGCGTIFQITPSGKLSTVYNFCSETNCTDGRWPYGGLVQANNGNFYGMTYAGGGGVGEPCGDGCGTIFELSSTGGELTTLYTFCSQTNCTDGDSPFGGLVQGADGYLYGTTRSGGANDYGTVFKLVGRTVQILHSFEETDGSLPSDTLVQSSNGTFYGTTEYGGTQNLGTIFKMTPAGKLTTLYSFCPLGGYCTDGNEPFAGLVQGSNGDFYGTTYGGGGSNLAGTVFKVTPQGTLTTLYTFCSQTNCADGENPDGGLIQGSDGNFYGTTEGGGTGTFGGSGTLFKMTPQGVLTTLYSFCSQPDCADGYDPLDTPLQSTNGTFYGTTSVGGEALGTDGTVFSLSTSLRRFVKTAPTFGSVGTAVIILGNDLTGATSVTFNGIEATFAVVSNTEITTTVPTGATTGKVEVVTPGRTLKSNVAFQVAPQITSFTPTSGAVGTAVTITGVSLTQTTKVTFGGVKASFAVVNDTTVNATVPTGALTGKIVITTPGGTATSATSFTVE